MLVCVDDRQKKKHSVTCYFKFLHLFFFLFCVSLFFSCAHMHAQTHTALRTKACNQELQYRCCHCCFYWKPLFHADSARRVISIFLISQNRIWKRAAFFDETQRYHSRAFVSHNCNAWWNHQVSLWNVWLNIQNYILWLHLSLWAVHRSCWSFYF